MLGILPWVALYLIYWLETVPRPKEFDPEKALDRAVQLFWRKGYEATSVQDLVQAMQINRFSLYDTFGDKHRLFLSALNRYCEKVTGQLLGALERSSEGLPAIRRYFDAIVEGAASPLGRQGCLMVNTMTELAAHDYEVACVVDAHRKRMEQAFHHALGRARARREISGSGNLRNLARFLTASALGLAVRAKTRPRRAELAAVARTTLAALCSPYP